MNKRVVTLAALCLWLGALAGQAQTNTNATANASSLPGKEIAQTISLITGVAISPLLGVGAVGAWQYYEAKTPEQKAALRWYANPWFWVPALVLVTACFIKDTAGTALPTVAKKPLDVAEAIEHKISGLVVTGAFVPIAASIFQTPSGDGASLSALGFAAVDLSWLFNSLAVLGAMVIFVVVFLASNAINILILLSPFTTVDAALKAFRTAILASVAASAWVNPWIGAAWALIIIGISFLVAGWSFRLSYLGMTFIWDLVTGRSRRFVLDPVANKMFLSRKISKVPARTYGKLSHGDQGSLIFRYRPWLVLPARTLILPEGRYEAGHGVFYSEIMRVEGNSSRTMILLPPRYLGHEDELMKVCGLAGAREVGLRAAWKWFKECFGGRTAAPA